MPDNTVSAVVLTSTEWRALLAFGDLRLSKRRVQEVGSPPSAKERDRLFSWAPTTVLGDGNDTVVVELVGNWLADAGRLPAQPSELVALSIAQVLSHHAVNPESQAYLAGDAEKEGFELLSGRYDAAWAEWVRQQQAAAGLSAARSLLNVFALTVQLDRKRSDGYAWNDIIRLASNSKVSVRDKPKHVESLLKSVRRISNAVAGVHGTAAFTLAANIEWVDARLGKDPLAKRTLRNALETALDTGRTVGWSTDPDACPSVAEALALLVNAFPRAYSPELGPEAVALATRLVMASKDQSLDPTEFASAIHRLTTSDFDDGAATICVAVSGALGPLVSRRLARALSGIDQVPLDWS